MMDDRTRREIDKVVEVKLHTFPFGDAQRHEEDERHIYSTRTNDYLKKIILILKNRYCGPELKEDVAVLWRALCQTN